MYAAAFPFAYFFGMVYSESVFLLALVLTVYALRTRSWLVAALSGAVMTATRVTGVMAVPGLALIAWRVAGARSAIADAGACRGRRARWRASASTVSSTTQMSGTPFAWYDAITFWGYRPGGNPFGGVLGLLQALVTRPYQFLATERMAPYDTLNALGCARRARAACR